MKGPGDLLKNTTQQSSIMVYISAHNRICIHIFPICCLVCNTYNIRFAPSQKFVSNVALILLC